MSRSPRGGSGRAGRARLRCITTEHATTAAGIRPLEDVTRGTNGSATKFVNDFGALGATYTVEALERAFADLKVDTIVLLSDGAPMKVSRREDLEHSVKLVEKILAWVRDINSSRRVRIDTFGFAGAGTWPGRVPFAPGGSLPPPPAPEELKVFVDFLKTLADESGGRYHTID